MPPRNGNETLLVPVLAALGESDAAFRALEASLANGWNYSAPGRHPGYSSPLLWDPMLRPLWFDRRFPSFLHRAGFLAYWRETRSRPDVCAEARPPQFCALIARPGRGSA